MTGRDGGGREEVKKGRFLWEQGEGWASISMADFLFFFFFFNSLLTKMEGERSAAPLFGPPPSVKWTAILGPSPVTNTCKGGATADPGFVQRSKTAVVTLNHLNPAHTVWLTGGLGEVFAEIPQWFLSGTKDGKQNLKQKNLFAIHHHQNPSIHNIHLPRTRTCFYPSFFFFFFSQ